MPNPRRYASVRWPSSRGTTGRFATDQVAGFAWNGWPESVGYADWRLDMFFENDGHPNNIGYDNIEKCVANYLF